MRVTAVPTRDLGIDSTGPACEHLAEDASSWPHIDRLKAHVPWDWRVVCHLRRVQAQPMSHMIQRQLFHIPIQDREKKD